jgi:hypothetical protein
VDIRREADIGDFWLCAFLDDVILASSIVRMEALMSIPSTGLGQDEKKAARRRGRPRAPPPEPLPFAHRLTASVAETVTATGLSKSLLYQHMK